MTIKQQGGIFGRNPTFNNVDVEGTLNVDGTLTTDAITTSGNVDVQSGFMQVSADPTPVIRLSGDGNNSAGTTFGELQFFNNDTSGVGPNIAAFVKAKSFSSSGGGGELFFGTIGSAGSEGQEATEQVKIDLSGNVRLIGGGNVVVNSGNGIDFSATSGTGTSELFDDYEEGNWTPTLTGDGGSAGSLAYTSVGRYTKIGRLVKISGSVTITAASSYTGRVKIGGVPYSSAAQAFYGTSWFQALSLANGVVAVPVIGSASYSQINFNWSDSGTGSGALEWSTNITTGYFSFDITYEV